MRRLLFVLPFAWSTAMAACGGDGNPGATTVPGGTSSGAGGASASSSSASGVSSASSSSSSVTSSSASSSGQGGGVSSSASSGQGGQGGASVSSSAGQGGAGPDYPAPHPSMPQLDKNSGVVLHDPVIVTVTWQGDALKDYLETFDDAI